MKTILVPTDFSTNADNALEYAITLAKEEKMKIVLLHAFQITSINPEVPIEFIAKQIKTAEEEVNSQLNRLCIRVNKLNIKCGFISDQGHAVDVILDTIKSEKIDLVIMGTKGASGIKEILIGSNTAKVIERALCPVIAVPEEASFKGIKKITYATNYHASDIAALKKLVAIATNFKAQINVLHISEGEYDPEIEKEFMEKFMKKAEKKLDYNNISYQLIYSKEVEKELEEYLKEKSANLLAISTRYRKLFERLFGKSITKKLVYHTKVPLMVFHYKQESVVFI